MNKSGLKDLASITDLVGELEASFPVDAWTASGIRVWPLVRTRLGRRLFEQVRGIESTSPFDSRSALLRTVRRFSRGAFSLASHRNVSSAGAVFLSDGISLSTAGGTTFDRWCEPYQRTIEGDGEATLLVVPWTPRGRPLRSPAIDISGATTRRLYAARAARWAGSLCVPGRERLAQRLAEIAGADLLMKRDEIKFAGRALDSLARMHAGLLERTRPRVGLAVEYYSLQGMAFMLACRRLEIPSVDIQHGVQGPHHPAYGSWTRVPADGYELLPDTFLVWDQQDADAVDAWGGGSHRAVVGGHTGRALWESGVFGDPEALVRPLRSAAGAATRSILVALGGDESPDELRMLPDLVKAAPPTWHWWIRCHPVKDQRRTLMDLLASQDVRNAEVELATVSPLPAVLEVSDVTLTRFSTVVRDAARVGVPSVLMDPLGAELFADEVKNGAATVVVAADTKAVVEKLERTDFGAAGQAPNGVKGLQWVRQAVAGQR